MSDTVFAWYPIAEIFILTGFEEGIEIVNLPSTSVDAPDDNPSTFTDTPATGSFLLLIILPLILALFCAATEKERRNKADNNERKDFFTKFFY